MKSREPLIRAKRFQMDDVRRRIAQIEGMMADFERMIADLERDIATEEQRSGIDDPRHFAYPPLAQAARGRRDNLRNSVDELAQQRDGARAVLTQIEADLALAEAAGEMERSGKADVSARRRNWRPDEGMRL